MKETIYLPHTQSDKLSPSLTNPSPIIIHKHQPPIIINHCTFGVNYNTQTHTPHTKPNIYKRIHSKCTGFIRI